MNNKLSPNNYFRSIIKSLDNDEVPQEWIGKQNGSTSLKQFFSFLHGKTEYLSQLKNNEYKIKILPLEYLSYPSKILKKLIEL